MLIGEFQVWILMFQVVHDLQNLRLQFWYTIVSPYCMKPEIDLFETSISMTCSAWDQYKDFDMVSI
mgnify:CR=1 FL=1